MAGESDNSSEVIWRCQIDGCTGSATVRHQGITYCASHALSEMMRMGVLTVREKLLTPLEDIVVETGTDVEIAT